ncbi:hypothetical protein GCM10010112_55830 [Actinoplanes lobatus]|uniref:Uncharacterized protein n=1 Tax=Actinoplanes lobatus TaxID=113568 RepID=A0A7W7HFJ3_9ACTN|nr:hypothetical protein [Actinoplanes lobatus]MBB4749197.1 hypothetical protein [Actinoplanes lobatus]GGN80359.1 hypothetical protein GCM10010112_55830 [Actinoplanes lobatus]GIE45243.1 hypothetical protein Alo02nite_81410 [Actinoplanes lobatus]
MGFLAHRVTTVAATTVVLALSASPSWAAATNNPPAVPTSLTVGGIACAPGGILVGTTGPAVTAQFTDADFATVPGETLTPAFVIWPAGEPARRIDWTATELTYSGTVFTTVPATLTDGQKYHLKARATDAAGAVSAWSPICTVTVDTTRPHAPVVTSTDYPENAPGGGAGITGKFTFAVAGGDRDVAKFRYSTTTTGLVEVPVGRDGRATVDITPTMLGTNVLTVQAIDRTLNRSVETTYSFQVIDHTPKVFDQNWGAAVGEPRTIQLSSQVPGTVSFTYRLNDGPPATATADAEGRSTVVVTPDRRGDNFLTVTSQTAEGVVSPETRANLYVPVQVPRPAISSPDLPTDGSPSPAGRPVTIILRTDSPDVTEFVYSVDFGNTEQVVTADENGNATFVHTTRPGAEYLEVMARARTADGFESDTVITGWELTPTTP